MIVREATAADLPGLLEIAKEFIAETGYGWTYDEDAASRRFLLHIEYPEGAVIVAEESGELAGLAILAHDQDFMAQRLGYVVKFYVRAPYRGTIAARGMVVGAVEWFQHNLCWMAFATATANIGEDKLFANLFGKFGFKAIGPTLIRNFAP